MNVRIQKQRKMTLIVYLKILEKTNLKIGTTQVKRENVQNARLKIMRLIKGLRTLEN